MECDEPLSWEGRTDSHFWCRRLQRLVKIDRGPTVPGDIDECGIRAVNPHGQGRENLLSMVAEASSAKAVFTLDPFEGDLASLPKPPDHLASRAEPSVKRAHRRDEPDIEVAPKPLRRMTSVVPQNGQDATECPYMINQGSAAFPRLRLGQVEPVRKEQCAILDMQGQLEERPRARWTKNLGRSASVPDGLVVARGRIVGEAGFLQDARRIRVLQQPVHPDAKPGLAGDRSDSGELVAPFLHAMPRIDSVHAKLTAFFHERRRPGRQIAQVVRGRPS